MVDNESSVLKQLPYQVEGRYECGCVTENILLSVLLLPSCTCLNRHAACPEGSFQLGNFTTDVDENGRIYQQGRVQVCMNGVYGAICDIGWDDLDAQVVCRNLGFDTPQYGEFQCMYA